MAALTVLTRSLGYHCAKRSKISAFSQNFLSHNSRFQTLRTLILEPSLSESVKLNRLSDYDSGIYFSFKEFSRHFFFFFNFSFIPCRV